MVCDLHIENKKRIRGLCKVRCLKVFIHIFVLFIVLQVIHIQKAKEQIQIPISTLQIKVIGYILEND